MESYPRETPDRASERADLAAEQLVVVGKELKEARKILARDWDALSPRERSAHSRKVKQIEEQERSLLEIIEMNRGA